MCVTYSYSKISWCILKYCVGARMYRWRYSLFCYECKLHTYSVYEIDHSGQRYKTFYASFAAYSGIFPNDFDWGYAITAKRFYNIGFTFHILESLEAWDRIHNTSYSSKIINGPNKLECCITLGWKCLPVTKTLAYLTHL
jgi:hypothetical protein